MYSNIMLNSSEISYDMSLIRTNIPKLFLNNAKTLFFKVNKTDKNESSISSFLCEWQVQVAEKIDNLQVCMQWAFN